MCNLGGSRAFRKILARIEIPAALKTKDCQLLRAGELRGNKLIFATDYFLPV
jgi:hypothetical protein